MINVAVDLETTGLLHNVHEIVEIGLVVFDEETLLETKLTFESEMKPLKPFLTQAKALEVNGFVYREGLPSPSQVRSLFIHWKEEIFGDEKLYPLGHNYDAFDLQFLKLWLGDWYDKLFDYHSRDSSKAIAMCKDVGLIPKTVGGSLRAAATHFNILHSEGHHKALHDASLSLKVYKACIDLIRR
jgi:DNA polymerase III epsilon subunit-like protein